jgi:hypothetical protein
MKTIIACVFATVLLAQQPQSIVVAKTSAETIHDIKNIYIGPLGTSQDAEIIRDKVLVRMIKSGQVNVVEVIDEADSLMLGSSKVSQSAHFNGNADGVSGGTSESATAGIRIVNRNGKILWVDDASNGFLSGRGILSKNATSSLADKIVKDLLKAMARR